MPDNDTFESLCFRKFNPLTPRRTLVAPFTKISIPFKEGIIKKISYERRAYESVDEKRPILGYVPKNDEKENLVHKGLKHKIVPLDDSTSSYWEQPIMVSPSQIPPNLQHTKL